MSKVKRLLPLLLPLPLPPPPPLLHQRPLPSSSTPLTNIIPYSTPAPPSDSVAISNAFHSAKPRRAPHSNVHCRRDNRLCCSHRSRSHTAKNTQVTKKHIPFLSTT